jgi:transcriptional regulator with XRE-family HTH domain
MTKMPLMDNFRQNLRRACEERGISQQELAKRSGVHHVSVSRILNGKQDPSVELCERLAVAAEIRADTVFLEPVALTTG